MVTIKFVGGAKKSFSTDQLEIDANDITIENLLELILQEKPQNTPSLDTNNILIAVNGADSSVMQGRLTMIKNTDLVSIIPIIHGGANKKIVFHIGKKLVQALEIKGTRQTDVSFLEGLRKEFPKVKLQAISSKFILNSYHLSKVLSISILSEKEGILLSNKIETDILMRFAAVQQISEAISLIGIKPSQNFVLIAIGNKMDLEKIYKKLNPLVVDIFTKDNLTFLKKHFKISKKQIDAVYSKKPLEDLLIEKAAVLL